MEMYLELMDASTWISMVDDLWNNNADDDKDDSCTLRALCRMNRVALNAPGNAAILISFSR